MNEIGILALLVRDRIKEAGKTQAIISQYASVVRSRLGFHELSEDVCSRMGIIILQLTGDVKMQRQLEQALSEIGGVEIKRISFEV